VVVDHFVAFFQKMVYICGDSWPFWGLEQRTAIRTSGHVSVFSDWLRVINGSISEGCNLKANQGGMLLSATFICDVAYANAKCVFVSCSQFSLCEVATLPAIQLSITRILGQAGCGDCPFSSLSL
jgi:hypothetical protein